MTHTRTEKMSMIFMAGAIVGSIVTALLTPRNGEEVRKTIKNRTNNMKDEMKNKADKAIDISEQKLDDAKKFGKKVNDKLKDEDPGLSI